ncbi:hypothetical protein [Blastococcus sp. Marseille-P5729]|uniref:hypothetical protein n=1 Tax=Blastococcus sp. Marseille-P5729 TaxID=2086582 RepID=UPI000D0F904C|nr:hypothetical protein [Blastococcus sp. Marseille-P5729]
MPLSALVYPAKGHTVSRFIDQQADDATHTDEGGLTSLAQTDGIRATGATAMRRRSRWSRAWAPLMLAVLAFAVSMTVVLRHSPEFSPIDEYMYYDALYQFEEHGMVRVGDRTTPEARHRIGCTGVIYQGKFGPECRGFFEKRSQLPFGGKTTADAYTPLYIASAYYGAKLFQWLGVDDLLTAARMTSPFWLAAGMLVFFALLRQFQVRDGTIIALGATYVGVPLAWWNTTFLTTDAPGFLAGSAVLLTAHLAATRKASPWWFVVIAALAVGLKVTHLLAVGLAIAYLLTMFVLRQSPETRRLLLRPQSWRRATDKWLAGFAVGAGLIAVLVQLVWLRIRTANAVGDVPPVIKAKFGLGELLLQSMNFLSNSLSWNVPPGVIYPMPAYLWFPIASLFILTIAGLVLGFLPRPVSVNERAMTWCIVGSTVLAAPLLATALYATQGWYFSIPGRYALPLIPAFLLLIGITFRQARAMKLLGIYAAILIAWTIGYTFVPGHY